MKKKSTVDAAEIKRQIDYARSLKEEDINTSAPDAHVMSEEKWATARPFREVFRPIKKLVSLRIDADVLDWYQRQGEGYQTRINKTLRDRMETEQKQENARA
jgi:uncharacterized protein (DUF4415 family)